MGLNPATFLKRLESIVTGDGFKRVIQGVNINTIRSGDGIIPTASTHPGRVAVETSFDALTSDANQTALGQLTFQIPRDYDATVDKLDFRFLAQMAGDDDDDITIDAAMYRKRAGAALTADLDPTISGAINTLTELADWVEVRSHGDEWQPGDAVCIDFTASTHANDAIHVYGIEVVYASDLAYYNDDERSISDE